MDRASRTAKNPRPRSAEFQEQSRAVAKLLGEVENSQDATQIRVIAAYLEALLSTPSIKRTVSLADLDKLDDRQFDNIISALRYARRTRRAGRVKSGKQRI